MVLVFRERALSLPSDHSSNCSSAIAGYHAARLSPGPTSRLSQTAAVEASAAAGASELHGFVTTPKDCFTLGQTFRESRPHGSREVNIKTRAPRNHCHVTLFDRRRIVKTRDHKDRHRRRLARPSDSRLQFQCGKKSVLSVRVEKQRRRSHLGQAACREAETTVQ